MGYHDEEYYDGYYYDKDEYITPEDEGVMLDINIHFSWALKNGFARVLEHYTPERVSFATKCFLDALMPDAFDKLYKSVSAIEDKDRQAQLRGGFDPKIIGEYAKKYLQSVYISNFIALYRTLQEDTELSAVFTRDMIEGYVQKYLKDRGGNYNRISAFLLLYETVQDNPDLRAVFTPEIFGQVASMYLSNRRFKKFYSLYNLVKDDPDLFAAITPDMIRTFALEELHWDRDLWELRECVSDAPHLYAVFTPDMVSARARDELCFAKLYNFNWGTAFFNDLWAAVKDDPLLCKGFTSEIFGDYVQLYLDIKRVDIFIKLYTEDSKDNPVFRKGFTPDMVSHAAKICLQEKNIPLFRDLYNAFKDDSGPRKGFTTEILEQATQACLDDKKMYTFIDMLSDMTPKTVGTVAQTCLDKGYKNDFFNLCEAALDDLRLAVAITPEMIDQAVRKWPDDIGSLLTALRGNAVLSATITPDMFSDSTKRILDCLDPDEEDTNGILSLINLCEHFRNAPHLSGVITPDMVGRAAQKLLLYGKLSDVEDLIRAVQDNPGLRSGLTSQIFSEAAHEYPQDGYAESFIELYKVLQENVPHLATVFTPKLVRCAARNFPCETMALLEAFGKNRRFAAAITSEVVKQGYDEPSW